MGLFFCLIVLLMIAFKDFFNSGHYINNQPFLKIFSEKNN